MGLWIVFLHCNLGYYNSMRETVANGTLKIVKIDSANQNVDILTKSLVSLQHVLLVNKIGLIDRFSK